MTTHMPSRIAVGATGGMVLVGIIVTLSALQTPAVRATDEKVLREYTGVYRWEPNAFVYLQMWNEFTGFDKPGELVAFDESGEVRTLYPAGRDRFFAGPGMAVSASIESRIEFQRDGTGKITSLTWQREGAGRRTARRVDIEKAEDIRFASGDVQLSGRLTSPSPARAGKHPAIVLVHGSGAEDRDYMLPWSRFLIRQGMTVLGYDKRGVGGSTGDWNTASFVDLAGDVVAAVEYLKSRRDIDHTQIGLLGASQAGWIMPLAAVRSKDIAFLISISGAGVTPAETTLDQACNEMSMTGMPQETVEAITGVLKLQYEFARTGLGGPTTPRPARRSPPVWGSRPTRSRERPIIRTGTSFGGRTSTIPCLSFVSSGCRRSPCGGSWTTTSLRKRTRPPGRPRSRQEGTGTTRCVFCRRRTMLNGRPRSEATRK